ncbi:hypothetical protein U0070_007494 [Myodes glareolus]|uniref:Uncharacterized protein n=1 Tax=Myodes glareolus TaxID=447135 RepID=A0AAW0J1E6_MYOGA
MEAEEADVDVEGDVQAAAQPGNDENTASVFQDHYLDSTWGRENGCLPWTLDSTISDENRAVIEKMLLEEEYYLSNKSLPEKFWINQKEDDKKHTNRVHSPTKPASCSVKWTIEEKELFEQGLAKFGRRWTKIATLVQSRTVLQVKTYARQYFKNQVKWGVEKETPAQRSSSDLQGKSKEERTKVRAASCLRGRADPNLNAVKIEKLSDDEDVDITDELDELTSQTPEKNSGSHITLDIPNSKICEANHGEFICSEGPLAKSSREYLQNVKPSVAEAFSSSEITSWATRQTSNSENSVELSEKNNRLAQGYDVQDGEEVTGEAKPSPSPESCESQQVEDSHEVEELKPPEQEVEIDRNVIQEEEKQAIPEFFEGRQTKTPERYLKIRNYILDQW